jgi:hypothetical protein
VTYISDTMSSQAHLTRFADRLASDTRWGVQPATDVPMHAELALHAEDDARAEERKTESVLRQVTGKNKVANSLATFREVVREGGRKKREGRADTEVSATGETYNSETIVQSRLDKMRRRMDASVKPVGVSNHGMLNGADQRAFSRMRRREDRYRESMEETKYADEELGHIEQRQHEVNSRGRVRAVIKSASEPVYTLGGVAGRADKFRSQRTRRTMMPSRRRYAIECAHQGAEEKYRQEQLARAQAEARETSAKSKMRAAKKAEKAAKNADQTAKKADQTAKKAVKKADQAAKK